MHFIQKSLNRGRRVNNLHFEKNAKNCTSLFDGTNLTEAHENILARVLQKYLLHFLGQLRTNLVFFAANMMNLAKITNASNIKLARRFVAKGKSSATVLKNMDKILFANSIVFRSNMYVKLS